MCLVILVLVIVGDFELGVTRLWSNLSLQVLLPLLVIITQSVMNSVYFVISILCIFISPNCLHMRGRKFTGTKRADY